MGMSSLWLTAGGTKIVKETEWNKFMSECDNKSGIRPFLKRSEWRLGRLIDRFISIAKACARLQGFNKGDSCRSFAREKKRDPYKMRRMICPFTDARL